MQNLSRNLMHIVPLTVIEKWALYTGNVESSVNLLTINVKHVLVSKIMVKVKYTFIIHYMCIDNLILDVEQVNKYNCYEIIW